MILPMNELKRFLHYENTGRWSIIVARRDLSALTAGEEATSAPQSFAEAQQALDTLDRGSQQETSKIDLAHGQHVS